MSFPRYPKYKDSGVEWLGEVPKHWDTSRTKNLFSLMKRTPEENDEIVTAFRDGEVTLRRNRRVDGFTNAVHEHGYQRILPGDLVIHAMDAFAGAIGVSDSTGKSTPVYSVCTPKKSGVIAHYYGRLLRHMATTGFVNSLSKGIRERSTEFRWSEASELILVVPSPDEQTRIVAFLDRETAKLDGLVAEQQRLIDLLIEKRQAIISQTVTKGLNPDAPMKPSGIDWLGDVPAHWGIGSLKRYWNTMDCKHITAEFIEDGIPLASIREVQGRWISLENAKSTTEAYYEQLIEGGRCPMPGDLIFSRNATVGEVAQVPENVPRFAMGQDVVLLRKRSADLSSDFMYHVLRSPIITQQLAVMMIGSTFKRINVEEIRSFLVLVPPPDEQAQIADYLECETLRFDALTAEAQRAITLLHERRTALIAAAVTGQIDVRHLAETSVA